jgi:ParB family chromosome partitioning protein
MMQPILVRRIDAHRHEIIAGERRFRAAQIAGLQEVPVIVREVSDENALAMALIENIQREDLNPLEEAQAIKRLIDDFAYTHERAAEAIGRSRSATSNLLRLLNLAPAVQTMLLAGDLEMGHARALLALDRAQQILVANRVSDKRLSVREAERLVAQALSAAQLAAPVGPRRDGGGPDGAGSVNGAANGTRAAARRYQPADRDLMRLQERIADHLATPVELKTGARGRGRLVIHFEGAEQFEGLLDALGLRDAVAD